MESDYISREAAIMVAMDYDGQGNAQDASQDIASGLAGILSADVVSRDCYDHILAENDTMREMLAQIGKKPGDKMNDVRPVAEISDAVDEAIDFLNSVSDQMPYHVYSALFDLICGICPTAAQK